MRLMIVLLAALVLGGCAYGSAPCHTAGEDYTAGDACH